MDQLGCKRYCCRRMVMTHVDLIEKLLKYGPERPDVSAYIADSASQIHPRRPQLQEDRDAKCQRPAAVIGFRFAHSGRHCWTALFGDNPRGFVTNNPGRSAAGVVIVIWE